MIQSLITISFVNLSVYGFPTLDSISICQFVSETVSFLYFSSLLWYSKKPSLLSEFLGETAYIYGTSLTCGNIKNMYGQILSYSYYKQYIMLTSTNQLPSEMQKPGYFSKTTLSFSFLVKFHRCAIFTTDRFDIYLNITGICYIIQGIAFPASGPFE